MTTLGAATATADELPSTKSVSVTVTLRGIHSASDFSRITRAIRNLSDFPASGAPLSSVVDMQTNYRFLVSGSYLVFYRQEGDSVYVVRVLYGRRDYMKILFGESQADEN